MVNSSPFQGEDYGFDPRPGYQRFPRTVKLSATMDLTPEERALLREETEDEQLARLVRKEAQRQKCRDYQTRKRLAVIEKLGGKCAKCGEVDPDVLQIDEHDKSLSWSRRYKAILDGVVRPTLLCAKCNWKKRADLNEATGRPRFSG